MNMLKKRATKTAEVLDDLFADESGEEANKRIDPEALAKQVTDPIIESMRKELEKIDVTRFKK